ncbi:hypothetical protein CS8_095820 [Cupriavidus sp. 8B]
MGRAPSGLPRPRTGHPMKLAKYLFLLYLVLRVLAACDHHTRPVSKEPMRRPVVYAIGSPIVSAALG